MNQRVHDIAVRLPKNKKHLKDELLKVCKESGFNMTQLVTFIVEDFLRRRSEGETLKVEL